MKQILLITLFCCVGIYTLYITVFAYRKPTVSVMVVSSKEIDTEALEKKLEKYLDEEYVQVEQISETTARTSTMLPTRFAAGDIDLMIAAEDICEEYLSKGMFENLESRSKWAVGIVKNTHDAKQKQKVSEYLVEHYVL